MSAPGGGDLGSVKGKIIIDSSEAEKGIDKADKAVDQFKKKQQAASAQLADAGKTAAVVYGTAVVGGFAMAVNAAKNFEQSLANVAAAGGKQAADQMDAIRKKALQLGADTKFSAIEAADAMEVLIKAGLSVSDVLNGAADAAVNLAAAEGISIPEAAEVAAVAMTAFNLEASKMPAIANEISQAASSTKMNVKDFSYAMNQAGAVSKLVGLSFDDMTLAITAMGKAGIVGSDAGTSLKTMLMNLNPQTKDQIALSRKLGLLTKEGANAFFDQTGKVKSMTDIAGVLQGALKGMTQQQKLQTLETLFGADAIRAAAIISEQGAQGMKNLTAEMNSQLSVAEKAKVRQDTLTGSIEKMKGSIETAGILIGTAFIPVFRDIAGAIEKAADWFSKLDPEAQKMIVWALLGSTALIGVTFVIVKLVSLFSALWTVLAGAGGVFSAVIGGMKTLGLALYTTGLQARAAAVSIGTYIAALARAAAAAIANAARMTASVVASFAVQAAAWIRMAAVAMVNALIMAAAWLIANPWALIIAGVIALVAIIIANWDTIKGWLLTAWNWIKDTAETVWNAIKQFFIDWWPYILGIFTGGIGLLIAYIIDNWDTIKAKTLAVWNAIKQFFVDLWNNIKNAVLGFFQWFGTFLITSFNDARNTISTWINNTLQFFRDLPGNIMSALGRMGSLLVGVGEDLIRGMINGVKNMAGNIANAAKDVVQGAIRAAKNALGISSPSKVFFEIGTDTTQGFTNALNAGEVDVRRSMELMATGGMNLTSPSSPFPTTAAQLGLASTAAPAAATTGGGDTINLTIERLELPVELPLDPTNPVQWRKFIASIETGLAQYVKGYK
jgi:TP901 family phage tail tape measure protein